MRIAGVNIPSEKQIATSLTYIYGIGVSRARKILSDLKIDPYKRTKDLSEIEEERIREYIAKNFKIEGDLKAEKYNNIKIKKEIGCYQGIRHKLRLPVRGQRTRTNARTHKGKAIAIAGKKKATK